MQIKTCISLLKPDTLPTPRQLSRRHRDKKKRHQGPPSNPCKPDGYLRKGWSTDVAIITLGGPLTCMLSCLHACLFSGLKAKQAGWRHPCPPLNHQALTLDPIPVNQQAGGDSMGRQLARGQALSSQRPCYPLFIACPLSPSMASPGKACELFSVFLIILLIFNVMFADCG